MAVLVQRPATTDCQLMMAGVTTTMTMERNPFLEKKVILDLDQFGSCVCPPTHLRCSSIISLMHPPSGPSSLHYFCSVASFDLEIFFLPLSQQLYVHGMHAYIYCISSVYTSFLGSPYPSPNTHLCSLSLARYRLLYLVNSPAPGAGHDLLEARGEIRSRQVVDHSSVLLMGSSRLA